jgi:hypothetical protein
MTDEEKEAWFLEHYAASKEIMDKIGAMDIKDPLIALCGMCLVSQSNMIDWLWKKYQEHKGIKNDG